jgi:hypothetical protein
VGQAEGTALTHAEQIIRAVARLVGGSGEGTFSRDEVRRQVEVSREEWESGYTAIFQAMREDEPGGAPSVGAKYRGVFRQVERGRHTLTEYGGQLVSQYSGTATWRQAVVDALHRFSNRYSTRLIARQALIEEELGEITREAESHGATPAQTLSRVLQELRDDGTLFFTGEGRYFLIDTPIPAEKEDLPTDAMDYAIEQNKLLLGVVATGDTHAVIRQRRGQDRVRELTLRNYSHQCAFCDVTVEDLLVAAHISRWSEDPEARGDLRNVICMCKPHDVLFEHGYYSLSDNYHILRKPDVRSRMLNLLLDTITGFRQPLAHFPAPEYLRKHRVRTGFER